MDTFAEKFKGEVEEYCEKLESGLLILENDPQNEQIIGEVFRIMHSMKGSGGMFGFDLLSDVTHDLETLFDIFRSKKRIIDADVIAFTLKSVDGLRGLMVQNPTVEQRAKANEMKVATCDLIAKILPSGNNEEKNNIHHISLASPETNQTTYYISFVPDENILTNGTNPLYLIDELNALGECNVQVSFDRLPLLRDIEPEKCYASWYLFIATSESEDTLRDVFIFVGDLAQIEIEKVAQGNVIHDETILANYLNTKLNKEEWEFSELKAPEIEAASESSLIEKEEAGVLLKSSEEASPNAVFAQTTVDSIRVSSKKIDHYMNLVSELITTQSRLELLSSTINNAELELVTESLGKLSRQLRDNAFSMSLIPLQSVATRFKRLIHDLSKTLDKEVVLVTEGMETELDKNIIERLIEPLLHLIRNSLDHGIESKTERIKAGKPSSGRISIKATTVGSFVQIETEDDGAGIDLDKIWQKAVNQGILSDQSKISEEETLQLIFEPGFSTAELVTDVSGRGVGMDVVRKRVREMRGSIDVSTEKGVFTRFTIKLPLSLSIIDGLLTAVGGNFYVIPTASIRKIHLVNSELLKKESGRVVELDDVQVPYLNIHDEFRNADRIPDEQFVVVVSYDNQDFGLVVDEVIREYQAVIKPLGLLMKGHDVFSGASILGTGQLALVIDINKMIHKYS